MQVNQIYNQDCLEGIRLLQERSISLVLTSPPYAQQRQKHYQGIEESDYPSWLVSVLETLKPKLTADANVLINIRSNVKDGQVSDYVLRTRLAIRDAGWIELEELIWYKPNGPPLGHPNRPRRCWEHILWYSQTTHPFLDLTECGRHTGNYACDGGGLNNHLFHATNKTPLEGNSRITDVIIAGVDGGAADKGIDHPARYPLALCETLIKTFSPSGSVVLDPFAGSGTTAIASIDTGRNYIGFEIDSEYYKLASNRIATHHVSTASLESLFERDNSSLIMPT